MEVLFVEFGLQQSEEYVNPGEGGGGVHLGILVGLCRPFFTPEKVEIISSLLIRNAKKKISWNPFRIRILFFLFYSFGRDFFTDTAPILN